jgi:DNA polymerase-1
MAALDGVRLELVSSIDQVMAVRRWAGERRDGPLFFDTESAGLNPHRDPMRLIQLGDLRTGWAFPPGWFGAAAELLAAYEGELGAHNSPYDWRVLQRWAGMTPRWERTHDTLLAGHICDSMKLAALKPRAAIEVDSRAMRGQAVLDEGMKRQRWTWATVPADWEPYWTYGALDPVLSAHLWKQFGPQVRTTWRAAYDLERATARICANMKTAGIMIDRPYVNDQIRQLSGYVDWAANWLRSEFGITNPGSGPQVSAAMQAAGIPVMIFTKNGNPCLDKDALDFYAAEFPQHRAFLDAIRWCRKANQVMNSLLGKFLELAGSGDMIHCSIWSCRAHTSRMSITDPAMQTFDRDMPMVRGSFIPREGMVFITIDADQIEARLGAILSGDANMIRAFAEAESGPLNFFQLTASRIYGTEITKKDPRYTYTKNATYAQQFGAGLPQAAATAGVPVEQMRPVYEGFQHQYPGVGALMNRLIREGRSRPRPYVNTAVTGRRLYGKPGHEYALLNYQVQGTAAEILKTRLVALDAAGFGPYMRLPMHDEELFEAPREYAADMLAEASRLMTDRTTWPVPITWSGTVLDGRWRKT